MTATSALTAIASAIAGRYRIDREIGSGGMATVFLVQDVKHDRRVAVKVLHPDLAATLGAERFLAGTKDGEPAAPAHTAAARFACRRRIPVLRDAVRRG